MHTKRYFSDNSHITIGFLTEDLSGDYQAGIWEGIVDEVKKNNINLLTFCGGSLGVSSQDDPWFSQGNVLFDIAEKNNLDGVIVAGSLGSYCDNDEVIKKFIARFSNKPIISLAPTPADIPAVSVDNKIGMTALMIHLLEEHNFDTIAFIRGPEGNVEAEERFTIFKESMDKYSKEINPDLIVDGDFSMEGGKSATRKLLKSSKRPDVIIAVDDETALGAMMELRKNDLFVPDDMAVVGFDNSMEAMYVTPPLTTVSQPLYEIGRSAVESLITQIGGDDVEKKVIHKAPLIIRESCGCFSHSVKLDKSTIHKFKSQKKVKKLETPVVFEAIFKTNPGITIQKADKIIANFSNDVTALDGDTFLKSIYKYSYRDMISGKSVLPWYEFLDQLLEYITGVLDIDHFLFANALLHSARTIVGRIDSRREGTHRIEDKRDNIFLHQTGDEMRNALGIHILMDEICEQMPELDIETFFVVLYESDRLPSKKSRLMLAVNNGERMEIPQSGLLFKTNSLLPEGIVKQSDAEVYVVEPLYFQSEQYGYIVMLSKDNDNYDVFDILRDYISGALHSSLLIKRVEKQSETLSKANKELERLREKEHAYLEAIKGELELGRKIQVGFLPEKLPQPDGWELAVKFQPAREVSGDFYDAFEIGDESILFVIADVSGKDVSAALFMALIRTLIRVFSEKAQKEGENPLNAVEIVNDYIIQHHRQSDGRCMFATMMFGVLNHKTGVIDYINAGHNPPEIISQNGIKQLLPPTGPAVGLAGGMIFSHNRVRLDKEEMLFCYTDGVTEAQSADGFFFTSKRLEELLVQKPFGSGSEMIKRVIDELDAHGRDTKPFDDITMFAIKRK